MQKEESENKRARGRNCFGKEPGAEIGYAGYEWVKEEDVPVSVDEAEIIHQFKGFFKQSVLPAKGTVTLCQSSKWQGEERYRSRGADVYL